jgi:hypothetical protein
MRMTPEQRKQYLSIASRRVKPGSGSSLLTLRERTDAYGTPDLHFLMDCVEFAIVGGLATRLYMPERMTLDTDILVRPDDAARAEAALRDAGCEKTGPLTIGGSTWRMPDGRSLDLVAFDGPWIDEAIRTAVRGKDGLPYITLPYLVLMKLGAGRTQDLADISRMLGGADAGGIAESRRIVGRYRPEDAEDLESMIRLGKLEYE